MKKKYKQIINTNYYYLLFFKKSSEKDFNDISESTKGRSTIHIITMNARASFLNSYLVFLLPKKLFVQH